MKNNCPIEVLIVEDNKTDAELTLRALNQIKVAKEINIIEDGDCALDYIFCKRNYATRKTDTRLKLVLLDVKLPKMNGFEILKKIRENEMTKKIPVVMLSSSNETVDIAKAYAYGANGYVVKPVNYDDYLYSIQNIGIYWLELNEV